VRAGTLARVHGDPVSLGGHFSQRVDFVARQRNDVIITDPLTSLARWTAPTWSIAGGVVSNTPTLSADILADGNMEAVGVGSWAAYGTPATREKSAAQAHGGSQSLHILTDADYEGAGQAPVTVSGAWYIYDGWLYRAVADKSTRIILQDWRGWAYAASAIDANISTWLYRSCASRATGTGSFFEIICLHTGADVYIDDLTAKRVTLATAFATRRTRLQNFNAIFPPFTHSGLYEHSVPVGIVVCLDDPGDPKNFIIAYHNGGSALRIEKCVDGVYTALSSTSVTYGATKYLSVKKNGDSVSVYYATTDYGALVATVTVSDAAIQAGRYLGLFSMSPQHSFNPASVPFQVRLYA